MSATQAFRSSGFAKFISSPAGRASRVVAGIILFAWGLQLGASAAGIALMCAGVAVFAAGAFGMCYIAALLGGPLFPGRTIK